MGRRRSTPTVEIKVLIPEEIYFKFERALTNDFKNKPEYGLRSQIITTLIQNWLSGQNISPATEKEPINADR